MSHTMQALLRKYQSRLRLKDWKIQLAILAPRDMENNYGSAIMDLDARNATIRLASNLIRKRELRRNYVDTMELSLVHELLEILLHKARDYSDQMSPTDWEQLVNSLAEAIVPEDRQYISPE